MYPPTGGLGPYGQYGNLGLWGAQVAYGTLNLTISSPPQSFTEPLDLLSVKKALKVDGSDDDQDLSDMIPAAREQAEYLQNRPLVPKQWDLSLDYWPAVRIELLSHLQSVDLIRYRDSNGAYTVLTENVDYIVDTSKNPGVVMPVYNKTWPPFIAWPSSAILIRFTAGLADTHPWWADKGARVKRGMIQLISGWYHNLIPFEKGPGAVEEYPYAVTHLLSCGAVPRVR